jgi:hypothetical protein
MKILPMVVWTDFRMSSMRELTFLSHAPADVFPYLGRRRGRTEVLHALSEVHKKLEVLTFWPITTVVEGNQAALTVVVRIKERTTNRSATFLAAHSCDFVMAASWTIERSSIRWMPSARCCAIVRHIQWRCEK